MEVLAHVPGGVELAARAAAPAAAAGGEAVRVLRRVGERVRAGVPRVGEAGRAGAAGGEELGGARHGRLPDPHLGRPYGSGARVRVAWPA